MSIDWWEIPLFFILLAGNTKLWVKYVNVTHSFALHWRILNKVRLMHDLAVPVTALLLLIVTLMGDPWTFPWGGSIVTILWRAYLGLCLLGFAWLMYACWNYLTYKPARQQIAQRSEFHDTEAILGGRAVGSGPYQKLTKLGFNEQFRVQFSYKTLALRRLPAEWERMKILHLSDWHLQGTVDLPYFEFVTQLIAREPADLIVFTGDLVDHMECLDWLPTTLQTLQAPLGKYYILGNHDWHHDHLEVRRRFSATGWTDASSRTFLIDHQGKQLMLGGDETPWMGSAPNLSGGADFKLLLSHTPDHFFRASREGIDLMLAGHIHGGQIALPIMGPVFAPSRYGGKYAEGTFYREPTLMHVSRGLSGRHPIRWRCLPEVTMLELVGGS